jgi:hypothetical protein
MSPARTWRLTANSILINSAEKADMSIFRCYSSKRPERLGEVRMNPVGLNLGFPTPTRKKLPSLVKFLLSQQLVSLRMVC